MSLKRTLLAVANAGLNRTGLQLLPQYEYRAMRSTYQGPTWHKPPIPKDAADYLTDANPRLVDLRKRYQGHPAAAHSQWSERNLMESLRFDDFRGDNHYIYQTRWSPRTETYLLTAYYVREADRFGLFGSLMEDGLFGAYTVSFDRYIISRDLLDSINQINVIMRLLGRGKDDPLKVLDIGAGYGRLAHRLTSALPNAHVTCTDAVPASTFLSEFYLQFRKADRAAVVPLDEAEQALKKHEFDVACNIHSFSECQLSAIRWWLKCLDGVKVNNLFILPNAKDNFLSTEADGSHVDFSPLLEQHGWKLIHSEPIYSRSEIAQQYALYPNFKFYLFTRG